MSSDPAEGTGTHSSSDQGKLGIKPHFVLLVFLTYFWSQFREGAYILEEQNGCDSFHLYTCRE
jgi:hypothetical protein